MGQSHGSKKTGEHGAGSNSHKRSKKPTKPLELKNILRPNGYFPPELLEQLFIRLDPASLIKATQTCKLWKETSIQVFKRLYMKYYSDIGPDKLPKDITDFAEAYMRHSISRANMAKGIYWAEDIAQSYACRGLLGGVGYTWNLNGNRVAVNFDKTNHTSYGPNTMATEAKVYNLESRSEAPERYGAHLYGGKTVFPMSSRFNDWDWDKYTITPMVDKPNQELSIEYPNKYVRPPNADPYAALFAPERSTKAFPNLDGSPTILLYNYHTSTAVPVKYNLHVYSLITGEHLFDYNLDRAVKIVGFFNDTVLCLTQKNLEMIDLVERPGNVVAPLPVTSLFYIKHDKMAIVVGKKITFYKLFSKLGADKKQKIEITHPGEIRSIAFDSWKLVVALSDGEPEHMVLLIMDMTAGFKTLTTIYSHKHSGRGMTVRLAANGSILVGDRALTVYDFNHPYLWEKIPVAYFKGEKLECFSIEPTELWHKAAEKLKVAAVTQLQSVTYYGLATAVPTRITFISARPQEPYDSYYGYRERHPLLQAMPQFVKKFGVGSVIGQSTTVLQDLHMDVAESGARDSVDGPCIMVFEQVDAVSGQWHICEPFLDPAMVANVKLKA